MPATEQNIISPLTERVTKLRQEYLLAKPSISVARAKAFTHIYKNNPGMPLIVLRAKAFKHACEQAPLAIFDNELIVSHPTGRRRAGEVSPDISWRWVANELDTLSTRSQDPYQISEEDKKTLRDEIFPFWQGRSIDEIAETQLRMAGLWSWTSESYICDISIKALNGGGDTCPGYDNILLSKGYGGIKKEAQEHLAQLSIDNFDDIDKIYFYQAMIQTCEGVIAYANRYATLAEKMAASEKDGKRKAELLQIADVCRHVPENPPRTFQEGLQSVWFAESLFVLEENQTGISLGRADQYLYPLYQADLEAGRISPKDAHELSCCWLIKMAEYMWITSKESAVYFAGYQPFINLVVGGLKRSGGDATNDLTYILMGASKDLGIYQPALAVRIHNTTPPNVFRKIAQVVKTGIGFPACHFDDAHIKMMLRKGFDYEDARDYCLMGCVEPQKSGKIYQWTSVGYTNWPVAIEFVLNNGLFPYDNQLMGLETGNISQFKTFEQFETAVKKQINFIIKQAAQATLILQRIHRDYAPKPLISSLVIGCMEKGKNVMDGGAFLNNGPGFIWTGLADYANSMASIKKLVYEDKKFTLEQIAKALADNFAGHAAVHQACINAPKYGNDNDYADLIAKEIVDYTEAEHRQYHMLYGPFTHGTLSISNNTPQGMLIGALPSGRLKGAPLADGISPSQQTDTKGPTAVIKSTSKVNVESMEIGQVHNFKLLRGCLDTPEGEAGFINLLRTASILGNAQMQFSYVDNKTLLAAQENPDDYRGLMIRVAGYSAFFVELCKEVQDEIISRTTITDFK